MNYPAETLSLLLGHLAAGSSLQLSLMARNRVTPAFYRFTGTLTLLLLGTTFFWVPQREGAPIFLLRSPALWQAMSLVALTSAVALLWSQWRGAGPFLFWPAGLLGTVSVVASALTYHSALVAVHFVASSLLLGAALLGMILGHWYLTEPGLPIAPLGFLSWAFFFTLCIRGGLTLLRLPVLAGAVSAWPIGLFVGIRLLVGLAIPFLLAVMILRCVKTRSTMSATGLLYLAMVMVCSGEAVARYLLLAHSLLL